MGEVSALFNNMIATVPHIKSSRLRALGVTTKARSPIAPEIPSVAESGLPGFEATGWFGAFLPAGTPDVIVQKLANELGRIANLKEVRDVLSAQGAVPIGNSSREFADFIRADMDRLLRVALNSAQVKSELALAETQWLFLKQGIDRLNANKSSPIELEFVVKSCDNILEVMERVTKLYEAIKA